MLPLTGAVEVRESQVMKWNQAWKAKLGPRRVTWSEGGARRWGGGSDGEGVSGQAAWGGGDQHEGVDAEGAWGPQRGGEICGLGGQLWVWIV